MRAVVLVILAVISFGAGRAAAQPANVPDLIKLIENQPSDMDRSTWKEKRRDAARKLALSKDKRGTPVLMNLATSETFDIVGEIAIEGLGAMGDQAAVPTLQAIVADTSRDKTSRDLAKKALAKLGAPEVGGGAKTGSGSTTTATTGTGAKTGGAKTGTGGGAKTGTGGTTTGGSTATTGGGSTTTDTSSTTGGSAEGTGPTVATVEGLETGGGLSDTGGGLVGETTPTTVENMPELDDDVIAASQRLTFALGSIGLRMEKLPADNQPPENSADKRIDFDADVRMLYERRLDTETKAYAVDVGADLVAGYVNPEGRGATRGALLDVHGGGEGRFYSNKLYGIGKAAAAFGLQYLSFVDAEDAMQDIKDTQTQFDLEVAIGGGYGRVVDVGAAIRVRRLAHMLDDARALGKPIDAATAKRLQLTWWALRGERSSFRALIATIAILREAGILLGEPNAVITYEILTVLRDTQLYARPEGFDAQLVISEGYLKRPTDDMDNCVLPSCGRVEQVIATVGYAQQMDDDKMEVSGQGYARYRLFAPDDGTPTPYSIGAGARVRRFTYGEHGDPFGALDVTGALRFSSNGDDDTGGGVASDKALRFEGELGFTYWINQASGIRAAAQLQMDQGTLFLGANLQGTYGLLDGVFAR
jgi:hypothetical protein